MEAFSIAFNAVVPIFLMMLLGYFVKKVGIIREEFVSQATKFVFRVSLPAMIFGKVASINLDNGISSDQIYLMGFLVVAISIGALISYMVGKFYIKEKHSPRGYVLGSFVQGSFRCNFMIIGYPVLLNLYGDAIVVNLALATLVVIPTFNVLSIIALTSDKDEDNSSKYMKLIGNIMRNPLIIAITLGFIVSAIDLQGPVIVLDFIGMFASFIDMVGKMATPLALVAIGAFFHFDDFKETLKNVIAATTLKLVVLPVIMSIAAMLLGFSEMNIILIVVLFGGPTAVSSFAMSSEMGGDAVLAGNIVILTSSLCVISYMVILTSWLMVFA